MIFTEQIDQYLAETVPERPPVMQEMEKYAAENGFPIVGPQVGRFLYQLAILTGAKQVVEFGSGFGYSAYWFSLAMGAEGSIVMTDGDAENKRKADDYLARAGLKSQFDFRTGDALQVSADIKGPVDIVFNDIDKEGYPETIDRAAEVVRSGGLFVTDNLLWSGRVADDSPDKTTQSILTFTQRLMGDDRFFTTLVPIRDGLAVALRR